jgi:hypothetical protein
MGFINLCLRFPNLDTMAFFLVFVVGLPYYFLSNNDLEALQYYLPTLVMLSVTLSEAGKPTFFKNLYPTDNKTLSGFVSRNIINLLAMTGLIYQALIITRVSGNVMVGLVTALITIAIAFPIAQEVLPVFIREGDKWFRSLEFNNRPIHYPGNWHKYFLGIIFIVFLILLEYLLLSVAVPSLMRSNTRNNTSNLI